MPAKTTKKKSNFLSLDNSPLKNVPSDISECYHLLDEDVVGKCFGEVASTRTVLCHVSLLYLHKEINFGKGSHYHRKSHHDRDYHHHENH